MKTDNNHVAGAPVGTGTRMVVIEKQLLALS